MTRRLLIILAIFGLVAIPATGQALRVGGGGSSSPTLFGTQVRSGSTVASLTAAPNVRLTNVTVTSATNTCSALTNVVTSATSRCNSVSATGTLLLGSDSTPLQVSLVYYNQFSWTVTLSATPAGNGYTPRSGSPINLNNLSGTLGVSSGEFSSSLTLSGTTYRGVSLTGTATVSASGVQFDATLADIPLPTGGSAGVVTISANSASGTVQASIELGGGPAVAASLAFTNRDNWTATISTNSAEGTAPSGAAVNLDNLSGTITKTNGAVSASLQLTGVTVGDTTFDTISLSGSRSGFEGTATASTINLAGGYTISNATVTVSTITRSASLAGTLTTGGTNVTVTAQYTDAKNWSFSIAANSAPAGYQAPVATSVDINDLSGTVTSTDGYIVVNLTVAGVTVGDGTFDMAATISSAGVEASANAADLVIGGFTLESAAISISTVHSYADITAALKTEAGNFDVDIHATALAGGGYHLDLTADGADLAVGGNDFYMQSFRFSWSSDVPATGCTTVDAAVAGSVVIKNATYTLNNAEVAFSCETLTKFIFSVTVTHKSTYSNQTKQVTLTINWLTTPGTYTPTFGPSNQFTEPGYDYYKGFFGTIDLSSTRGFSRSGMDRDVTLGLGFTLAVYEELAYVQTGTKTVGRMKWPVYSPTAGPWAVSIGAMGYFDADRVSGEIDCEFLVTPSTDFTCGGDIRINPSFAGVWHYDWTGI